MTRPHRPKSSVRTTPPRELEIKFEVTPEEMARFRELGALAAYRAGEPSTTRLRSIYFDTADHALRRCGIALRVREQNGTWVQTIKAGAAITNGVSHPMEIECDVDGPQPDIERVKLRKLRQKLRDLTVSMPLEAIFETVVTRTTRQLMSDNGSLELALDEGVVRCGDSERPLREIELELKAGSASALLDAAEQILSRQPLRLSSQSKADRGYDLTLGRAADSPKPSYAERVKLRANLSCREALLRLVAEGRRQIEANRKVVLETDDPEGAHQLRVGLTRLRAVVRLFDELLDAHKVRRIDMHARNIARTVGALRDDDVLIEEIHAPASLLPGADAAGMAALRQALVARRARHREAARLALQGEDWSALQLELTLWPSMLQTRDDLDRAIGKWAPQALKRTWAKVEKRGRRISALSPEERHSMRKALKRLRYGTEFLQTLYPSRKVRPFAKRMKALQDVFGYLNDVETAGSMLTLQAESPALAGAMHQAIGFTLGWHKARAEASWSDARAQWRELKKAKKFWN